MKANKFVVSGINDSDINTYEQSIKSHDGINAARIDMQANTVTVDYDEGKCSTEEIKSFINEAGLKVIKH